MRHARQHEGVVRLDRYGQKSFGFSAIQRKNSVTGHAPDRFGVFVVRRIDGVFFLFLSRDKNARILKKSAKASS